MIYNSMEIVWNAEPKDVVYMSPDPYMCWPSLLTQWRSEWPQMASLIQTIAVPYLHHLSKKVKIISTTFSYLTFILLHLLSLSSLSSLLSLSLLPLLLTIGQYLYFHLKNHPTSLRLVQLFQPSSKNIDKKDSS